MAAKSAPPKAAGRRRPPILVIDRGNLIGWLLVGVTGCALMFVAGILVGRDSMPVRFDIQALDQKLGNLKESVLSGTMEEIDVLENVRRNPLPELGPETPHTLSPKYAKADSGKKPVAPEELPQASPAPPAEGGLDGSQDSRIIASQEPENRPADTAEEADTPGEKEARSAPGPAVTKRAQEKPKNTASVPLADTGGRSAEGDGYVIQVASLKDSANALKVRDRFLKKGYPAYLQKASVGGSTFYRIRIGPYPDRKSAAADRGRLSEAGVGAIIVSVARP
jgi:cell division septation protein DedD